MKQQRDIRITVGLLIASTFALGHAAGAAGISDVQTNGRAATEVYGRASASQDFAGPGKTLHSGSTIVTEVLGRGSVFPAIADKKVWVHAGDVGGVYGRASGANQFAVNVPNAGGGTLASSK